MISIARRSVKSSTKKSPTAETASPVGLNFIGTRQEEIAAFNKLSKGSFGIVSSPGLQYMNFSFQEALEANTKLCKLAHWENAIIAILKTRGMATLNLINQSASKIAISAPCVNIGFNEAKTSESIYVKKGGYTEPNGRIEIHLSGYPVMLHAGATLEIPLKLSALPIKKMLDETQPIVLNFTVNGSKYSVHPMVAVK